MKTTELDKETIERFIDGQQKAFSVVYLHYSKIVYKHALFLLKDTDEVDELVQNLFLKLWYKRSHIDPAQPLKPYILKIAHSMTVDVFRRRLIEQQTETKLLKEFNEELQSVEDDFFRRENWIILQKAIEQLPPQRKLIFNLCKIEEKSYAEVSQMLQISSSTISNQLVIAMKSIKAFIKQYNHHIKLSLLFFLTKF